MEGFLIAVLCFIPIFLFLLVVNPQLKFFAKVIYFYFMTAFVTGTVMLPYMLLRPKSVENIRGVATFWNFALKIVGVEIIIQDGHYLESDKPYIVTCNHQSGLDVIGMMKCLPKRMTVLAKKELLYAGTFGFASWLCGIVFIDRLNKDKSRSTMEETAQLLHDKNIKLWIYPEGTRNLDGELHPFKKGAFHLAIQAQVPIVPVVLSSYQSFYSPSKWVFESGKVIFKCLPPIPTEGLQADDVNELTEKTHSQMAAAFKVASEESAKLNARHEHLLGKTQ